MGDATYRGRPGLSPIGAREGRRPGAEGLSSVTPPPRPGNSGQDALAAAPRLDNPFRDIPIGDSLRAEIGKLIEAASGQPRSQIRADLLDRYGDFAAFCRDAEQLRVVREAVFAAAFGDEIENVDGGDAREACAERERNAPLDKEC